MNQHRSDAPQPVKGPVIQRLLEDVEAKLDDLGKAEERLNQVYNRVMTPPPATAVPASIGQETHATPSIEQRLEWIVGTLEDRVGRLHGLATRFESAV